MSDTLTAHFSWTKPDPGGSAGTWDTKLNADLDDIDADLFAVSEVADAAATAAAAAQATADLALAGNNELDVTAITLTGGDPYVASIDLSVGGPVYRITQSHSYSATDCELTFTNRPVGVDRQIFLHFIITVTGGGADFSPIIQSASKQWVLPFDADIAGSGTQTLATINGTRQRMIPLLVVGS